jgi:hypothetical protein
MIEGGLITRKKRVMAIKKFGEPHKGSPKYITNTPKYSYEFKIFSFLTTYFII